MIRNQHAEEEGAEIRLNTPVKRVIVDKKVAKGVELEDGTVIEADDVLTEDADGAGGRLDEPVEVRESSSVVAPFAQRLNEALKRRQPS